MKRQLIFGTMLSATLAVGVAAQQPPATGTTPPAGQPPSDRPAQPVDDLDRLPEGGDRLPPAARQPAAPQPRVERRRAPVRPAVDSSSPTRNRPGRWLAAQRRLARRLGTDGRGCDRNGRQRERSVDLSPDGWRQPAAICGTEGRGYGNGCLDRPRVRRPAPGPRARRPGAEKPASGSGQGPALRVTTVRPTGEQVVTSQRLSLSAPSTGRSASAGPFLRSPLVGSRLVR